MTRRFAVLLVVCTATACSSSGATSTPVVVGPAWDAAPATLDVYDGRLATVPVVIATAHPATLTVTAASGEAEAEIAADAAPSTDGAWHGTLKVRPG